MFILTKTSRPHFSLPVNSLVEGDSCSQFHFTHKNTGTHADLLSRQWWFISDGFLKPQRQFKNHISWVTYQVQDKKRRQSRVGLDGKGRHCGGGLDCCVVGLKGQCGGFLHLHQQLHHQTWELLSNLEKKNFMWKTAKNESHKMTGMCCHLWDNDSKRFGVESDWRAFWYLARQSEKG